MTPSYYLHTAIREAIQAHAEHYRGGAVDMNKALSALGEAATRLLSEIPDVTDRVLAANALTIGIARTVRVQVETQGEAVLTQQ